MKWDAWKAVEGLIISYQIFVASILNSRSSLFHSYFLIEFLLLTAKSKDEAMTEYIIKVKQLLEEAAAAAS